MTEEDEEEHGDGPRQGGDRGKRRRRPPTLTEALGKLLPEESRKHLYEARKECLLAVRSAVDEKIERLEEKKEEGEGGTQRIEVE